ncbi:hypothetical protein [Paenibacillus sp. H1-7]|uniref:glycosyl hydrolase family 95 catalytic domain-containing protein n=1 Tax=Paenibacillus sp. H1-7 TaxID=2282849 RepID=UPI001EF81D29|nr:hypothetical protein [Paenibacillus sp. H1-7]
MKSIGDDVQIPLREMAKRIQINRCIHPSCPHPQVAWSQNPLHALTSPSIKASLWGPPEQITLSMIKSDIFDRRMANPTPLTIQEIREGAYSKANEGFSDIEPTGSTRPKYGTLDPRGGRREPYAAFRAYPFPCQKPVGQIIVKCADLSGLPQPTMTQHCDTGMVSSAIGGEGTSLRLDYLLCMKRNIIAVRTDFKGLSVPLSFRLYRHKDQGHRVYMNAEGTEFKPRHERQVVYQPRNSDQPAEYYNYEAEAEWNGPIAPPENGGEGRFFWIKQCLPAEKTFPDGFEYVMMGLVSGKGTASIHEEFGHSLGTQPYAAAGAERHEKDYMYIREAQGAAVTATLTAQAAGNATLYVAVVTSNDAADILAEAKRQLLAAEEDGFEALCAENADWYGGLYDKRENGRVFYPGEAHYEEEITNLFYSWFCKHSGGVRTDSRRFEASASYATVETDAQLWHGLPCYNEPFYTSMVVRGREDALDMWGHLVENWLPAARMNANEVYGLPGMLLVHGYLPPVKPDRYVHSNSSMELCLETGAQVLKVLWDIWDYGVDEALLRRTLYPALRDLAVFYAAYIERQEDGLFHIVPAVEAECWGVQPNFEYNKDTISAICMFRWTFRRAAELADYLGMDQDLKPGWLEAADNLPPYPMVETEEGPIFAGVSGIRPRWQKGCHPWYVGIYPTTLADEIHLDSSRQMKDIMLRTARLVPASSNKPVFVLLGECKDTFPSTNGHTKPIESYKQLCLAINDDPERVINSRSGRIHLFSAVPDWAEISFSRFQARGGFLVSASKNADGVGLVTIEARRTLPCYVMNPWPGHPVHIVENTSGHLIDHTIDRSNNECVVFDAEAGKAYQLSMALR